MNEQAGGRKRGNDLYPLRLREVVWNRDDGAAYVEEIARLVTGEADGAINWYLEKKRSKSFWARTLRMSAIVAATVAGVLPIVAEISATGGVPAVAPAWASVALGLAAGFIALDKFFGFSSAWMRFLTTEFQIRRALHGFEMDWQVVRAGWKDGQPADQQVIAALERCRAFLADVDGLLRSELDAWVQEFRTVLMDSDESVKARAAATKARAGATTKGTGHGRA